MRNPQCQVGSTLLVLAQKSTLSPGNRKSAKPDFSAVSESVWLLNWFSTYFERVKLQDYDWDLFSIGIRQLPLYKREDHDQPTEDPTQSSKFEKLWRDSRMRNPIVKRVAWRLNAAFFYTKIHLESTPNRPILDSTQKPTKWPLERRYRTRSTYRVWSHFCTVILGKKKKASTDSSP